MRFNALVVCALATGLACRGGAGSSGALGSEGTGGSEDNAPRATQVDTKAAEKVLVAGDSVSDFFALAHTGERAVLSRYLQRPVLVYFCASDSAQPCVDQATAFRDAWLRLNPHLSMVFGVSPEDMLVHSAFASEQHLPFLLLGDSSRKLRSAFGLKDDTLTGFLVGTDRKILRVFHPADGQQHVNAVLTALSELKLLRPEYPK